MNASPNDGIDRTMKYCKCDKPKEWQGDNYCRECNGLIESRLKAPSADSNPYHPFETEMAWLDYENNLIERLADRIMDTESGGKFGSEKLQKIREAYRKSITPSATVDEKLIGIDDVVKLQQTTDAILHSQQEKRYTREEVIDVGVKIVGGEKFRPFVIATLDQFDKEGK